MENEELMKPRYKVIADYPGNNRLVGVIIPNELENYSKDELNIILFTYNKYPAVFKKLEWWEERGEKDMPKFIKNKDDGHLAKIEQQSKNRPSDVFIEGFDNRNKRSFFGWVTLFNSIPATEEEYNNYITKLINP